MLAHLLAVPAYLMRASLVQPVNAPVAILVTLVGIFISTRAEQPLNMLALIVFIVDGSETFVSLVQPVKAYVPILVIPFARVILVSDVQPLNA